jgi:hypothetical protein
MTLAKKSLSDMLVPPSSPADIAAAAAAASRPDDPPEPQRLSVVASPPYSLPAGAAPEAKAAEVEQGEVASSDPQPAEVASTPIATPTDAPATKPEQKTFSRSGSGSRTSSRSSTQSKASSEPEPPKYMTFTRKEARLRDDQVDDLSMLARKLARASRGGEERITDNTLIRVAVDMLLAQSSKIQGSTEEEIRKSLMR